MRRARVLGTALAVLALVWSTTIARGDQPPVSGKPRVEDQSAAADDPAEDLRMSAMGRLAVLARTGRLEQALQKMGGPSAAPAGRLSATAIRAEAEGAHGDDEDEAGPSGGQAETSIAVDSTGQHIVVGFNDTRGFARNPVSVSGFMYSDDGGATFVDGGQLPSPGNDMIGTTKLPQIFGDPEVKYLGGSNFIYFSIMVKKFGTSGAAQTMCFHRSTDNGHTWEGPFEVGPATNPNNLVIGVNARDSADKEFADVDPETGRVIMSWSNFTSAAIAPGGVEISTTFSDNVMAATPTWSPRVKVSATNQDGQASIPRFAAGSPNVYVAWRRTAPSLSANVGFARSTDNGATFEPAVNLTSPFKVMDQVLGNDRVNTSPSLAVDNSGGAHQGNVYVVYSNNSANDGADVMFQRSLDQGMTFSAAVALNSRPGNDRAQWFPWVTVDRSTGRVYVFYYDQGIADAGDLTEVTVLHSDDGGLSWSRPAPLSDRPFHAGYGNDTGQPNIGDYNQAVAQNGELFATFAATTPVGFADGQPESSFTTPDVVFKRVPASTAKVSLSLRPVSFADAGGNGFIDPGELVRFTLPLFNYYTNTGASPVTGISAMLSTPTIGVSVVNATRSYPDIPPGTSAPNTESFNVQVAPSFVAGTPIELALVVSTAQGSTTLLFMQATGTPSATTIFEENFDSVPPGTLPPGWRTLHAGGPNIVPWTTNNTFMGTGSNAAFHVNANDGFGSAHTRFERLATPDIEIPADAEYVLLDFDVAYNTEDDPNFNVQTFDGFLLRITDFTPGRFARAVQIEAFAEEFTTGGVPFYPKHMPRNANPNYLQDLSAWGGLSSGPFVQHVHLKLPGMAGSTVQLRWEYTQDSNGICTDVRPGSGPCGVAVDNIVMRSVVSVAGAETTVTSSQNPSDSGEPVTFTATVTSNKPVTGEVTFKGGATILAGPMPVDASGDASFTTSTLAPGAHTIVAEFSDGPALAPSSGSVVQTVDELPTVAINDVSLNEGTSGISTAVFTVTLSAATHTVTAQVDFATADGSATTANNDYVAAAGTVTFAPGETSRTIAVSTIGDTVYEPDETFVVNLSNPIHSTIRDGQGVGTILNDDPLPTISVNDVSVMEGDTGTTAAVFTVSLSNQSSAPVLAAFATANGTAKAPSDYIAASGTVVFAPLATTQTITVSVNGDFVIEPDETFFVNLSSATGGTIGDGQGAGTIRHDDTVQTTLRALIAQVAGCTAGSTSRWCRALAAVLAAMERDIAAGRTAAVIRGLQQFVFLVQVLRRPIGGRPPFIDPATAAIWIEETQSIITALTT